MFCALTEDGDLRCNDVVVVFLIIIILQDALFFLKDFFTSLATDVELFSPPEQEGKPQYA